MLTGGGAARDANDLATAAQIIALSECQARHHEEVGGENGARKEIGDAQHKAICCKLVALQPTDAVADAVAVRGGPTVDGRVADCILLE